ncbi:PAS domain-containing protein [Priestia flexa]|uniref:PAS domain S-box protein n=1 Tax=Priestia flexa TaxID=86664 RepID=A0A8I1SMY2_9BACI|nr:PAS domain-containing protein [Priestia flexa]MBN8250866.1 PAS domain S-box protein [Priestia flexa]
MLSKSEKKYRSWITHYNSGVCIVDLNGNLVKVNEALEKMTGYSSQQLKEIPYDELIERFSIVFHTNVNINIFNAEAHRGEITLRNKHGERLYVTSTIVPIIVDEVVTGAFVILHNHTKETEARLLLTKTMKDLENMKYALDESAIVVSIDKEGYVTYVNDMFIEVSDYSKGEAIGAHYGDVGLNTEHEELLHTIREGSVWRGEVANRNKNGQIY